MRQLVNGARETVVIHSADDDDGDVQWWVDTITLVRGLSDGDRSVLLAVDPRSWPEGKWEEMQRKSPGFAFIGSLDAGTVIAALYVRLARFGYLVRDHDHEAEARTRLLALKDTPEVRAYVATMVTWKATELGMRRIGPFIAHAMTLEGDHAFHTQRFIDFHRVKLRGTPVTVIDVLREMFGRGIGEVLVDDFTGMLVEPPFTIESHGAIERLYAAFGQAGYLEPADPPINAEGRPRLAVTRLGAATVPFCLDHRMMREPNSSVH